ncbi:MAG TPA: site-specific DNA-methyltransferase, partial [Candidatus Nitrosotenuis sp.]|nr:site-specific DNA-methyltransferase [Candidatus Nitrosotenuis sp.]
MSLADSVSPRTPRGARNPGTLNELDVRTWMRFTRSWFVCNPPPRKGAELRHPAKFPEQMARDFIAFFSRPGEIVLDPFCGTGSAVLAAAQGGRRGVGIELAPEYHEMACNRPGRLADETYLLGDARCAVDLCRSQGIEQVHYVLTSPPYWDMLGKSRGGVFSVHKERKARGLSQVYSAGPGDLGRIEDYGRFLGELAGILIGLRPLLAPRRYLTVVVQNVRVPGGEVVPLA